MNFSLSNALISPFTSFNSPLMRSYASRGSYPSSMINLSSLLNTKHGFNRSSHACRNTACVCTHTPSTTSTSTKHPSLNLAAVETSEQKSTCPGESINVINIGSLSPRTAVRGVYSKFIPALFIVIPRRCSSSRKSINRINPACLAVMNPLCAINESLSVVFP